MSTRSRSSLVSILITCGSVMRSVSTPHGMKCPQHQKTAGTFRPLERGLYHFQGILVHPAQRHTPVCWGVTAGCTSIYQIWYNVGMYASVLRPLLAPEQWTKRC